MRKNFLSILILFLVFGVTYDSSAQTENKAETLFNGSEDFNVKNLGFFIAPGYGIAGLDGDVASLYTFRAGAQYKSKIALGGYYNVSVNRILPQSETLSGVYMDYWVTGGFLEYTLFSNKLFHVTFPLYLGYGEVEMDNESGDAGLEEAGFLQVEPAALLEINLHKYVRLNVGTGYRFVGDMNYRNIDQTDLAGFTGFVGLKFGLFR